MYCHKGQCPLPDVTGVSVSTVGGKHVLLKAGEVLPSLSLSDAIARFITWLQSIGGSKSVLIAHNCISFDMRLLVGQVKLALGSLTYSSLSQQLLGLLILY